MPDDAKLAMLEARIARLEAGITALQALQAPQTCKITVGDSGDAARRLISQALAVPDACKDRGH